MVICHIAPFAPSRCGLYEMARDMSKADALKGHQVIFIDCGVIAGGKAEQPIIGGVDNRGNFNLVTGSIDQIDQADLIFMHSGCPDSWLVTNQTPLIWVVHGRPKACFIPNNGSSYELYNEVSKWKRSKYMLYFWDEFRPHWNFGNDLVLDFPVIDTERFCAEGEKYKIVKEGQKNILISDSDREDIGLYDLIIGCIETAKQIKGLKFHFIGSLEFPIQKRYQMLLNRLNEFGALGDVMGRITDIEKVYRSMDVLLSPNKIIVRTIAEALCSKLPVIAQNGCKVANVCVDFNDPNDVVEGFKLFMDMTEFEDISHVFSMENYSKKMEVVYNELYTQK
jgi:glycosyltransferase involved in cell wall biosynthesis